MKKPECELCGKHFCEMLHGFYQQFLAIADLLDDSEGKVERWKYADFLLYVLTDRLKKDYPDVKYPNGTGIGSHENS